MTIKDLHAYLWQATPTGIRARYKLVYKNTVVGELRMETKK
jgi:hypothetical protein